MDHRTLILKAAEHAVKEMIESGSSLCAVFNENHTKSYIIDWSDVLIGLRDLESEEK